MPLGKPEDSAVIPVLAEVLNEIKATNNRVSEIINEFATMRRDFSGEIHAARTDLSGEITTIKTNEGCLHATVKNVQSKHLERVSTSVPDSQPAVPTNQFSEPSTTTG
jgi:G3E family GTPase